MGYGDLREGNLFVHEGKQETCTIKKGFIPSIVKAVRKTARQASLCVCVCVCVCVRHLHPFFQ